LFSNYKSKRKERKVVRKGKLALFASSLFAFFSVFAFARLLLLCLDPADKRYDRPCAFKYKEWPVRNKVRSKTGHCCTNSVQEKKYPAVCGHPVKGAAEISD